MADERIFSPADRRDHQDETSASHERQDRPPSHCGHRGGSPMIAAIYARKSTEQNGLGDEAKSVTRQIEHARAYAERKGWTVAEEHIYTDDGISGALFGASRPGLARLLASLSPRP